MREVPEWTKRYHYPDPVTRAFGGELIVSFNDGTSIARSIDVANAHPSGARPFQLAQYVEKFCTLSDGIVEVGEQDRFLGAAQYVGEQREPDLAELKVMVSAEKLATNPREGIF